MEDERSVNSLAETLKLFFLPGFLGLQRYFRADTSQNMICVVLKPLCNMTAITLDLRPVVDLTWDRSTVRLDLEPGYRSNDS